MKYARPGRYGLLGFFVFVGVAATTILRHGTQPISSQFYPPHVVPNLSVTPLQSAVLPINGKRRRVLIMNGHIGVQAELFSSLQRSGSGEWNITQMYLGHDYCPAKMEAGCSDVWMRAHADICEEYDAVITADPTSVARPFTCTTH